MGWYRRGEEFIQLNGKRQQSLRRAETCCVLEMILCCAHGRGDMEYESQSFVA